MNAAAPGNVQGLTAWTVDSMMFNDQSGDVAAPGTTMCNLPAAQPFSNGAGSYAVSSAIATEGT